MVSFLASFSSNSPVACPAFARAFVIFLESKSAKKPLRFRIFPGVKTSLLFRESSFSFSFSVIISSPEICSIMPETRENIFPYIVFVKWRQLNIWGFDTNHASDIWNLPSATSRQVSDNEDVKIRIDSEKRQRQDPPPFSFRFGAGARIRRPLGGPESLILMVPRLLGGMREDRQHSTRNGMNWKRSASLLVSYLNTLYSSGIEMYSSAGRYFIFSPESWSLRSPTLYLKPFSPCDMRTRARNS